MDETEENYHHISEIYNHETYFHRRLLVAAKRRNYIEDRAGLSEVAVL
jgi:hypothetical protein